GQEASSPSPHHGLTGPASQPLIRVHHGCRHRHLSRRRHPRINQPDTRPALLPSLEVVEHGHSHTLPSDRRDALGETAFFAVARRQHQLTREDCRRDPATSRNRCTHDHFNTPRAVLLDRGTDVLERRPLSTIRPNEPVPTFQPVRVLREHNTLDDDLLHLRDRGTDPQGRETVAGAFARPAGTAHHRPGHDRGKILVRRRTITRLIGSQPRRCGAELSLRPSPQEPRRHVLELRLHLLPVLLVLERFTRCALRVVPRPFQREQSIVSHTAPLS